jgi:hypothetical protein
MKTSTMMRTAIPRAPVGKAWEEVSASFDRFCLAAGIETLNTMMETDAEEACGPRHSRSEDRRAAPRLAGQVGPYSGSIDKRSLPTRRNTSSRNLMPRSGNLAWIPASGLSHDYSLRQGCHLDTLRYDSRCDPSRRG